MRDLGRLSARTILGCTGARLRVLLLGMLAFATVLALGATPAGAYVDLSGPAYQILAPGEEGGLPPNAFSTDQGELYDNLTHLRGSVTTGALERDYIPEKFGVVGPVMSTETPEPGLEIQYDEHDIPHINGTTRPAVMFGSGWVAAKFRGILLALALGPAYAAADGIPGVNAFELLLTARSFTPSAHSVEFVAGQVSSLIEKGPAGEQVITDLENWAEGINAYEESIPPQYRLLPPINLPDAIAGFAFIGSIFGNGGGNEVTDSDFLARLEAKLGASEGLKVFRDLREVNDPEAPTTIKTPFPYDTVPTGPTPGAAVIDPGSESATAVKAAAAVKASRRHASNFLLVPSGDSKSGHPIAVMGPQLGYFYPEIVMQGDLHGPGIDAEGIIAPISPYVFIGRGRDFAWSLTSAGSENTQQFLEQLCEPEEKPVTRESHYYMHDGECIKMNFFDAGEIGEGNGEPAHELTFWESIHGPISGTVTIGGKPYAIANDRATRGREPAGELAFSSLDSDKVHSPEQFFEAANQLETTFNVSYIDSTHTAYFSAGRLPILAPGTDPSLPTLGTGEYEWRGFLGLKEHPHEVASVNQPLTNWNNKPAPEFGAASETFSYGPVHRVQLYSGFKAHMKEANDVSIMNKAATSDLRAVEDWPVIKQVLEGGPAPSPLAKEAEETVNAWAEKGGSDYGLNHPGNPAEAILNTAWDPIAEAVLSPVLGSELTARFESFNAPDEYPSFDSGWYGYVYKDLRTELGLPVNGPFSREYCGNGSLSACRTSLWAAMQTAVEQLTSEQGSNPKHWRAPDDRITFAPGFLPYTMRWTNRSTFQQVIEFTGHETGEEGVPVE